MSATVGITTSGTDELGAPWYEHKASDVPDGRYRAQYNPALACWDLSFHVWNGDSHDWFIPGVVQALSDDAGRERVRDWLRETWPDIAKGHRPANPCSCFTCRVVRGPRGGISLENGTPLPVERESENRP